MLVNPNNTPNLPIAPANETSFTAWYYEHKEELSIEIFNDYVLFEVEPQKEEISGGGIIIPEIAQDNLRVGIARFVTKGWMSAGGWIDCPIAIGDRCIFGTKLGLRHQIKGYWFQKVPVSMVMFRLNRVSDPRLKG